MIIVPGKDIQKPLQINNRSEIDDLLFCYIRRYERYTDYDGCRRMVIFLGKYGFFGESLRFFTWLGSRIETND